MHTAAQTRAVREFQRLCAEHGAHLHLDIDGKLVMTSATPLPLDIRTRLIREAEPLLTLLKIALFDPHASAQQSK